ncbi:MAG: DUF4912 domain-containing protein [Elusimicrobiota bacterium]|jgi:hypothetical protein|nr:DUF4912 domain-containing protein [Elusimicrobiota bacterium]
MKINDFVSLPTSYNDTKIKLLPKDPLWMFTYWEISQETKSHFTSKYANNISSLALRVYDVAGISFDGSNFSRYFDIWISESSDHWYINIGEYNKVWCVEVGYLLRDGGFATVARSNCVRLPKYGISNVVDDEDNSWASIHVTDKAIFEQVGNTSTTTAKFTRQEWEDYFDSYKMPSSKFFNMPSSSSSSSFSSSSKPFSFYPPKNTAENSFWLKADMEVTIYGATVPGSTLTIQGKAVPLKKDGSFRVKFYFSDGAQQHLVEAVSSHKDKSKRIVFIIDKQTK